MRRLPYKKRSKKRGPVVSKKVTYDGINFVIKIEVAKGYYLLNILPILLVRTL
jgi:hypothetical protein